VQIGVGISGQVVVDGQVNSFDINTTSKDVCGDTYTLVEFLEFFVAFDAVFEIRL
jgi:hypothetical protein